MNDSPTNREQYAELITHFPLFQGYTLHGAQLVLAAGEVQEVAPRELVFKEGDPPASVLLVLSGKLQAFVLRQGGEMVLSDAGPGTVLGELAVICGIPRAASARATEKTVILKWPARAFRKLLLGNSFLSERILGQSLRTLIQKERSLIDSVMDSPETGGVPASEDKT